jgi:hypothetical protein
MTKDLKIIVLEDIEKRLHGLKSTADRALEQVSDEELFIEIDEESNSLAIIMKHVAGNMVHTWTNPFTPVEEKPDRKRDTEFVIDEGDTGITMKKRWEAGWKALFDAFELFQKEKLTRKVTSRGRELTLLEMLSRQVVHYAQHVGQILFLGKHIRGSDWIYLSTPKKK